LRIRFEVAAGFLRPGHAQEIRAAVSAEVGRGRGPTATDAGGLALGVQGAAARVDTAVELPASPDQTMYAQWQRAGRIVRQLGSDAQAPLNRAAGVPPTPFGPSGHMLGQQPREAANGPRPLPQPVPQLPQQAATAASLGQGCTLRDACQP